MVTHNFADDIPRDLANRAHAWTSHTPEKRGEQEISGYAAILQGDLDRLTELANKAPDVAEALARLAAEFGRYRSGYRRRFLVHLERRSRCASTMITGGSGFNVRRNEKANRAEEKASEALTEYRKRALAAIRKAVRPDLGPIMSGDDNAVGRLEKEIAQLEALQKRMKDVNVTIRKHAKAGRDAQVSALLALGGGLTIADADSLLKPDFAGRVGFADYQTKNNNVNIRRLKGRLEAVSRAKAIPETVSATEDGIRVEDCPADNRVRIYFPGKPDEATRAGLKAHGFRWTPSLGCWQAYRNHSGLTHAATFTGVTQESAAPVVSAPVVAGARVRRTGIMRHSSLGTVASIHPAGESCERCIGKPAHAVVKWDDYEPLCDEEPAKLTVET